jgi:hypothetical protein
MHCSESLGGTRDWESYAQKVFLTRPGEMTGGTGNIGPANELCPRLLERVSPNPSALNWDARTGLRQSAKLLASNEPNRESVKQNVNLIL